MLCRNALSIDGGLPRSFYIWFLFGGGGGGGVIRGERSSEKMLAM